MLYLVATPVGHLSDITYRAVETLKRCDYILCEDTRRSRILLDHYQIVKPLKSYHKFNESFRCESVLADLEEGKQICLISDAGTPGICDPGADLVRMCIARHLPVTMIPGPCALIQAIGCSGLQTDKFQFCGFLPRKENELRRQLQIIFSYQGTTICYESPHRLVDVLIVIESMQPDRELVIARELTKKYEEILRGKAEALLKHWKEKELKGEIVLLFASPPQEQQVDWTAWTPAEHVQWMQQAYHIERKEAIKLVADLRGVPKRDIYRETIVD